uniref:Uncharacterized protein n=1 Tax=viral metagenome TaxID=1070528 RepID=A0A6M3IF44_9ZZZZ
MATFAEIANTPLEVDLGGKKLKVRRLPLDVLFGKAEAAVVSKQLQRIHEMADTLVGDDKASFLAKAMVDSIPSGTKLQEMTDSYLRSKDGVKLLLTEALRKDQPNIEREIDLSSLILEDPEKVTSIIKFLVQDREKKALPLAESPAASPA